MKQNKKEQYPYQSIFERDNFTCQYCGLDASKDFETWWHANLNIDHIVPKSRGGSIDDEKNLVVACRACNLYKGSSACSSIEEARKVIAEKRAQAETWFRRYVLKEK
jgi:5-methylcytosine-specific restriction endonuclease McrA